MEKRKAREMVFEKRKSCSEIERKQWNKKILHKIIETEEYKQAETILIYVSLNEEADTRNIIAHAWENRKRVAVPGVSGKEMSFYYIDSFKDLKPGAMGILEPSREAEPVVFGKGQMTKEKVLVIMPGVAFDEEGNRVGYGAGYYDRWLKKERKYFCDGRKKKVFALAFEFQIFDRLYAEEHDQKPDLILTQEREINP